MFPSLEFLNNLNKEASQEEEVSLSEIDFPVIKALDLYKKACGELNNKDFLAILKEGAKREPDRYYTFSDIRRLGEYVRNYSDADSVLNFINSIVSSVIGDLDWRYLVKVAKQIRSEDDFIEACKHLRILSNDDTSRTVRNVLANLVKRISGRDYYFEVTDSNIEDLKEESLGKVAKKLKTFADMSLSKKEREELKEKVDYKRAELVKKIAKIPDDSGWVSYLIDKLASGELSWGKFKRELFKKTNGEVKREVKRILKEEPVYKIEDYDVRENPKSAGIVKSMLVDAMEWVDRGFSEFEIINKLKQKWGISDKEAERVIEKAKLERWLDKEGRLNKQNRKGYVKKAQEDADKALPPDEYIGVGDAVRIEGNPASPYYGKVGLVEWIKDDGWAGINLRDGTYIERWVEDLAPVTGQDYWNQKVKK